MPAKYNKIGAVSVRFFRYLILFIVCQFCEVFMGAGTNVVVHEQKDNKGSDRVTLPKLDLFSPDLKVSDILKSLELPKVQLKAGSKKSPSETKDGLLKNKIASNLRDLVDSDFHVRETATKNLQAILKFNSQAIQELAGQVEGNHKLLQADAQYRLKQLLAPHIR